MLVNQCTSSTNSTKILDSHVNIFTHTTSTNLLLISFGLSFSAAHLLIIRKMGYYGHVSVLEHKNIVYLLRH